MSMDNFDSALSKMQQGIIRAHDAFNEADAGFIAALESLRDITRERGSIESRLNAMQETIGTLQQLVLNQTAEIRQLRDRLT